MIFFTADHHFGHDNIRGFCDRPFRNVGEMDAELVRRCNETTDDRDTVYHLGDFTLGGKKMARGYFEQLRGEIKVLGYPWHHDKKWLSEQFDWVEILPPLVVLNWKGYPPITLCHYPLESWDRSHHGAWHLHGHSHGKMTARSGRMDVGVDANEFRPVSLEEVATKLEGGRQ